jgi:hypothetical protein
MNSVGLETSGACDSWMKEVSVRFDREEMSVFFDSFEPMDLWASSLDPGGVGYDLGAVATTPEC